MADICDLSGDTGRSNEFFKKYRNTKKCLEKLEQKLEQLKKIYGPELFKFYFKIAEKKILMLQKRILEIEYEIANTYN